jgi:hypothetical protein
MKVLLHILSEVKSLKATEKEEKTSVRVSKELENEILKNR